MPLPSSSLTLPSLEPPLTPSATSHRNGDRRGRSCLSPKWAILGPATTRRCRLTFAPAPDGKTPTIATIGTSSARAVAPALHLEDPPVGKHERAAALGQQPGVVWFTGISGAGKSTIANLLERRLHQLGHRTYLLDGDNVRQGLNRDLGFSDSDRVENIRRVAEVARLMVDAGLIVLVAFISPFRDARRFARSLVEPGEFVEVFVNTPLAVAERRDCKGLYAKARRGELKGLTGIDSPYEPPPDPELELETVTCTAEQAADRVLGTLRSLGLASRG